MSAQHVLCDTEVSLDNSWHTNVEYYTNTHFTYLKQSAQIHRYVSMNK